MEMEIFKLFLISIILLINTGDSKQDLINIGKLEETYVGLIANFKKLLLSEQQLKGTCEISDKLINELQPLLTNPESDNSHLKRLDENCPNTYSNINSLQQITLRKLSDNSKNHNQKFDEISSNINCFGIKPEMIEDMSLKLKDNMSKYETLIGQVESVIQMVETYKEPKATVQLQYDEFAKILAEINGKLHDQDQKLEQLEEQIPFIEMATEYVSAKKKRSKCTKYFTLDVINKICAAQNK